MTRDTLAQRVAGYVDPASYVGILVVALAIGLLGLGHSGEQWLEDGPRYCNNGAMVHDWLVSGNLLDPVGFAKENYIKYPAHSLPYHPPGYAVLLGTWFLATGMSYASARCFVALCLGVALCFFHGILRRQGIVPWVAICATLLLATSPEIARWSRSAMSEIPGMAFILAGSYCFVRSVDTERGRWCWLAFVLAEIAFFCRLSTAGVLPAWFLFLIAKKGFRRILSPNLVIPAIAYLTIGVVWCRFASSLAANEVRRSLTEGLLECLSIGNLSIWIQGLPGMVGWITLAAAMCGLGFAFRDHKTRAFAWFWLFWFLSCYALQVAQSIHFESRYFIFSVPAICALAVGIVPAHLRSRLWRSVAFVAIIAAIVGNAVSIFGMPQGMQGYDAVADQLASQEDPGNVLMSCWDDSDLIFRFRCHSQKQDWQIIRGDRVLAIRSPSYAGVASTAIAESSDDVLEIIRRGRIRYLVTCAPPSSGHDRRPADMVLAHQTALTVPERFTLLGRSTLLYDRGNLRQKEVFLWRFEGDLPDGKSELSVRIPTANMILRP